MTEHSFGYPIEPGKGSVASGHVRSATPRNSEYFCGGVRGVGHGGPAQAIRQHAGLVPPVDAVEPSIGFTQSAPPPIAPYMPGSRAIRTGSSIPALWSHLRAVGDATAQPPGQAAQHPDLRSPHIIFSNPGGCQGEVTGPSGPLSESSGPRSPVRLTIAP